MDEWHLTTIEKPQRRRQPDSEPPYAAILACLTKSHVGGVFFFCLTEKKVYLALYRNAVNKCAVCRVFCVIANECRRLDLRKKTERDREREKERECVSLWVWLRNWVTSSLTLADDSTALAAFSPSRTGWQFACRGLCDPHSGAAGTRGNSLQRQR